MILDLESGFTTQITVTSALPPIIEETSGFVTQILEESGFVAQINLTTEIELEELI